MSGHVHSVQMAYGDRFHFKHDDGHVCVACEGCFGWLRRGEGIDDDAVCMREHPPAALAQSEFVSLNLADERADIIARFTAELTKVTGDGSRKRQAGTKPPWYEDDAHEAAVFSHLTKWKRGETVDPDSGAHPLVHAAWRLLAIALIETGNTPNPE